MKKWIRIPALVLFGVTTGACGMTDKKIAEYRGYAEICIDGVKYLQFTSGASVKYGKDGHVELCK